MKLSELFYRFITGQPLFTDIRTDATFFLPGRQPLDTKDRPPKWHYWPRYYRVIYRLFIVLFILGYWYYGLIPVVCTTTVIICACLIPRIRRVIRMIQTDRRIIKPLWTGLVHMGIYNSKDKWTDYIHIPATYRNDHKAIVTVAFPEYFESSDEQKKRVSRFVARKLGGEWDSKWIDQGNTILRLTHTPQPPKSFTFAQCLTIIKSLNNGELFVGLGARGQPVIINMDKETPHVAITAGSGAGKSSLISLLTIQILSWNARVIAIDPKMVSFNPLRHLPNIDIIRGIESQWDTIAMVRAEMDRRYEILNDNEDELFPRWVLILEEQNAFYTESFDYWEMIKPRGAPSRPPVYRDISAILNKGRQCNINVISIYQRASAQVCGGGDVRSQYGYFILGRYKKAEWKMFIDLWPWIPPSRVPGRFTFYNGEDFGSVQAGYPFVPDSPKAVLLPEATDFVNESIKQSAVGPVVLPSQRDGAEQVNTLTTKTTMTLREAVEAGIITCSLAAAQKAAQRNGFPAPSDKSSGGYRYRVADLLDWEAQRLRKDVHS